MSENLFSIYTKEVDINGKIFKLRPLCGRYLPKLYSVMTDIEKHKDKDGNISSSALTEENITKLHTLIFETLKKSYPDYSEEQIDEFTSQHLMDFIEPLLKVNVNTPEDAERSG